MLITNDVDEGILLADRVIPLTPDPGATLGTIFPIEFQRPRDKAAINADPNFKKERNSINSYLLELGKHRTAANTKIYRLPEIEPQIPGRKRAIV
jgi:nitrate/nitrite transport system ATP-binding protein